MEAGSCKARHTHPGTNHRTQDTGQSGLGSGSGQRYTVACGLWRVGSARLSVWLPDWGSLGCGCSTCGPRCGARRQSCQREGQQDSVDGVHDAVVRLQGVCRQAWFGFAHRRSSQQRPSTAVTFCHWLAAARAQASSGRRGGHPQGSLTSVVPGRAPPAVLSGTPPCSTTCSCWA